MSDKKYQVHFLQQAEGDLLDLFEYIAENDSAISAQKFIDKIEKHCMKLAHFPLRGNYPKELRNLGISDFRELNIKPYRIIYQVITHNVFIHAILDGRRDLEDYLYDRLIFR